MRLLGPDTLSCWCLVHPEKVLPGQAVLGPERQPGATQACSWCFTLLLPYMVRRNMAVCCPCSCVSCPQTFYMYNMSQQTAFWIVTALILPLSQVSWQAWRTHHLVLMGGFPSSDSAIPSSDSASGAQAAAQLCSRKRPAWFLFSPNNNYRRLCGLSCTAG